MSEWHSSVSGTWTPNWSLTWDGGLARIDARRVFTIASATEIRQGLVGLEETESYKTREDYCSIGVILPDGSTDYIHTQLRPTEVIASWEKAMAAHGAA